MIPDNPGLSPVDVTGYVNALLNESANAGQLLLTFPANDCSNICVFAGKVFAVIATSIASIRLANNGIALATPVASTPTTS